MGWGGKHGWLGDVGSLAAFRSIQPWAGCTEYWTFKYCCIAFTGDVMSYARQMLDTYPPHCRVCGEACRRCERACRDLLDALA